VTLGLQGATEPQDLEGQRGHEEPQESGEHQALLALMADQGFVERWDLTDIQELAVQQES